MGPYLSQQAKVHNTWKEMLFHITKSLYTRNHSKLLPKCHEKSFRMIFWECKWHCLPGTSLKSWPSPNKIRVWKCVLPIFSAMWWCVCISCTSASLYTLSEFVVSLKIYLKSWSGQKLVSAVMPSLNPAKNYLAAAIQIRHVMEVKKECNTLHHVIWSQV